MNNRGYHYVKKIRPSLFRQALQFCKKYRKYVFLETLIQFSSTYLTLFEVLLLVFSTDKLKILFS